MSLTLRDPDFEARVRSSFARQDFMVTLGAVLAHVAPGEVDIVLPFSEDLRQQHGFFHAGATIAVLDSAAGYAALTLFPKGFGVLTAELKVNLLAPAEGPRLQAEGRVIKPGKTLTICRSDVHSVADDGRTHVATALLTMAAREGLDD